MRVQLLAWFMALLFSSTQHNLGLTDKNSCTCIQLLVNLRKHSFISPLFNKHNSLHLSIFYLIEITIIFINTTHTLKALIACIQILVQVILHSFRQYNLAYIHTHIHAYTDSHMPTYNRTYMPIYAHIYMYTRRGKCPGECPGVKSKTQVWYWLLPSNYNLKLTENKIRWIFDPICVTVQLLCHYDVLLTYCKCCRWSGFLIVH